MHEQEVDHVKLRTQFKDCHVILLKARSHEAESVSLQAYVLTRQCSKAEAKGGGHAHLIGGSQEFP